MAQAAANNAGDSRDDAAGHVAGGQGQQHRLRPVPGEVDKASDQSMMISGV